MGTLSLVWGIIFIVGGIFGSIGFMMMLPFPYGWIPSIVLVIIGSLLIKKYDKDRKK